MAFRVLSKFYPGERLSKSVVDLQEKRVRKLGESRDSVL
jgi:hypothetical protein